MATLEEVRVFEGAIHPKLQQLLMDVPDIFIPMVGNLRQKASDALLGAKGQAALRDGILDGIDAVDKFRKKA